MWPTFRGTTELHHDHRVYNFPVVDTDPLSHQIPFGAEELKIHPIEREILRSDGFITGVELPRVGVGFDT